MNKIAIVALLVIVLIGCAPVMPARNQTMNKTTPAVENTTVEINATTESNATMEEKTEETKPVDTRDLPKKEVVEGELVSFPNLRAVDPDGDKIDYTFSEPLDEKGHWKTTDADVGEHVVTITASDGTNTVSQQVLIVVKSKNKAPTIELEQPVQATEGETLTLEPVVTDPDGDEVTVEYSGWMNSSSREVGFDESGNKKVIITATDSKGAKTSIEAIISIAQENRAPSLADIPPQTIKEGQKVTVKPSAKDPDGDSLTYTFDTPFDEKGQWSTVIGDAGDYEVLVTASDGTLTDEKTFVLTVLAVNRPPVIELESPVEVSEGETVTLEPVITDPEGDEVRVSYSGWMNSNTKAAGYEDQGEHTVVISARDTAGNEARLEVTVVVGDQNRPPIFGAGSFS
jgi:hypothetical protein